MAATRPEPQPHTRTKNPPAPILGPFKPIIDKILSADAQPPRKQRHTAGWSPGGGTEYSTDNFNWAAAGGVLGTFNFDKLTP